MTLAAGKRKMNRSSEFDDAIATNGYATINVRDVRPAFTYTVGLMFSYDHPEVILLGLDGEAGSIFAAMVEDIQSGKSFAEPGLYNGVLVGLPIATREVHRTQHEFYLGYAMGHCREHGRPGELQAVQAFWPDKSGLFPFDVACDSDVSCAQPRLDLPLTPSQMKERRSEISS